MDLSVNTVLAFDFYFFIFVINEHFYLVLFDLTVFLTKLSYLSYVHHNLTSKQSILCRIIDLQRVNSSSNY